MRTVSPGLTSMSKVLPFKVLTKIFILLLLLHDLHSRPDFNSLPRSARALVVYILLLYPKVRCLKVCRHEHRQARNIRGYFCQLMSSRFKKKNNSVRFRKDLGQTRGVWVGSDGWGIAIWRGWPRSSYMAWRVCCVLYCRVRQGRERFVCRDSNC
jgi:hypothetical protein